MLDGFGQSKDWVKVGRAFVVDLGMIVVAHGKLEVLEDGMELVGHLDVSQWSRVGLDVASSLGYM